MNRDSTEKKAQVVYFSHGGGPLPILGDPGHKAMVDFMMRLPLQLTKPDAILVVNDKDPTSSPLFSILKRYRRAHLIHSGLLGLSFDFRHSVFSIRNWILSKLPLNVEYRTQNVE